MGADIIESSFGMKSHKGGRGVQFLLRGRGSHYVILIF